MTIYEYLIGTEYGVFTIESSEEVGMLCLVNTSTPESKGTDVALSTMLFSFQHADPKKYVGIKDKFPEYCI